jgi:hypothetical protein
MTISSIDFPDAARQAVLDGMSKRASARGFWTPKLKTADPASLRLCAPHRIALLPLSKMQREERLLAAGEDAPHSLRSLTQILGWRFLIINDQHVPIAAAHAFLTENGDYRLGELNEGPYVASTFEAFQSPSVRQAMSPKMDGNPFEEVLLLFAPAIYFAGLWVRFQREDPDFILPLDQSYLPAFDEVEPRKLLSTLCEAASAVPADSHSAG